MKSLGWMVAGILLLTYPALMSAEERENSTRMRVSDIMGEKVQNLKGDDYGTVGDMIFHENGTVDYIILVHGGILGMGESIVPVPWKRVVDSDKEGFLVIDLDDELLKNAPSFSEEEWQKFEKDEWNEKIKKYYGY